MTGADIFINPNSGKSKPLQSGKRQEDVALASRFHRQVLPSYAPSRLIRLQHGGLHPRFKGQVLLKAESNRYGLPAFKVLGAAYASYRTLCSLWSLDASAMTLTELKRRVALSPDIILVAATDGNHGTAVGWFANLIGLGARIYIPDSVEPASEAAIAAQGPNVAVHRLHGIDYDGAVRAAASFARAAPHLRLLIQDTAWDGYVEVPQLIVDGYSTIFDEIQAQLDAGTRVTHVICPVGVGSLAQSMVEFYQALDTKAKLLTVEPTTAACLYASLQAGTATEIKTGQTVMPGLNCGTVSSLAWPHLVSGIEAAIKIEDQHTLAQVAWLQTNAEIKAGPCGAAPLAALSSVLADDIKAEELGLLDDETVNVVLLMTEGASDGM